MQVVLTCHTWIAKLVRPRCAASTGTGRGFASMSSNVRLRDTKVHRLVASHFCSTQSTALLSKSTGIILLSANMEPGRAAQQIVVLISIICHIVGLTRVKVRSLVFIVICIRYRLIDIQHVLAIVSTSCGVRSKLTQFLS